jgi:Acid Phosphatase
MKLAIFDLDYTIWQPEMYQLYGAPTLVPSSTLTNRYAEPVVKEMTTNRHGMVLVDGSGGSPMRVFPGAYVRASVRERVVSSRSLVANRGLGAEAAADCSFGTC